MIRLMAVLVLVAATGCAKKVHPYYLDEPADPTGEGQKLKDTAALEKLLTDSTLHFGFDEASLTEADRTMLEKVAFALRSRPTITIRIAGHADERGTEEYNLQLSNRRAASVKRYLMDLGVKDGELETVGFGENRPAMQGASEAVWEANRRVEFNKKK